MLVDKTKGGEGGQKKFVFHPFPTPHLVYIVIEWSPGKKLQIFKDKKPPSQNTIRYQYFSSELTLETFDSIKTDLKLLHWFSQEKF